MSYLKKKKPPMFLRIYKSFNLLIQLIIEFEPKIKLFKPINRVDSQKFYIFHLVCYNYMYIYIFEFKTNNNLHLNNK